MARQGNSGGGLADLCRTGLELVAGNLGWKLGGQVTMDANVTATSKQIEISKLSGGVTSLDARNSEWWIKGAQTAARCDGQMVN